MKYATLILILLLLFTTVDSQIPDQPTVDFEIYYGYEWGAAGIASALTSTTNLIAPSVSLNNSIGKAMDYIIQNRFQFNGMSYFAWEKGPNLQSGIYPGIKYGAAGIIISLSDAYQLSGNQTYLQMAQLAMQELMNEAIDNQTLPHWGYSYGTPSSADGIALTGLNFGAAGVIKAAITLFETTGNNEYLLTAQKIFNWINSVSTSISDEMLSVPWYANVPGFASVEIYEYSRGMAGIVPTLMELGILTSNTTIQEFARKLGNYLMNKQLDDGSWTVQNDTDISTPFLGTGTAGIILGLSRTQELAQQQWFNQAITKGILNLISLLKNGIISIDQKDAHNSFLEGTLGVFHTLFALSSYLSEEQKQTVETQFQTFLETQLVLAEDGQKKLLLLKLDPKTSSRFDLSLGNGLAGLVYTLSENKQNPQVQIGDQNLPVLETTVDTLIYFQNQNGSWNRQVTTNLPLTFNSNNKSISIPGVVIAIPILILVKKRFKNHLT